MVIRWPGLLQIATCSRRRVGGILALILLLNVLLSLPGLWVPYFNVDELTNALHGRFLNLGWLSLRDFLGDTYLLTHYLYAFVFRFVPTNTMVPMHVVHAFIQVGVAGAMYLAGRELDDRKTGLWAALFYTLFSHSFLSKDFFTPSAESFSLLPAAFCVYFVFKITRTGQLLPCFFAGLFAALATFFKAPMGVLLVSVSLVLLGVTPRSWARVFFVWVGFGFVLFFPALLIKPFGSGFLFMLAKVTETKQVYINAYEDVSFLYWMLKFVIRTGLVLGAGFGVSVFALYGIRSLVYFLRMDRAYWRRLFFLTITAILLWFVVAIGKRVFFHYFVFLLLPLSLLAATGVRAWDERQAGRVYAGSRLTSGDAWENEGGRRQKIFQWGMDKIRCFLPFLLALPAVIFFVEASFNVSTRPVAVNKAIAYVANTTRPEDRVFVWGNLPQMYFFSERMPSTVHFWADVLAGTLPGSPAMEYIRATHQDLNLRRMLIKDFQGRVFEPKDPDDYKNVRQLSDINENELFTIRELLSRIEHPYWQKVFRDFLTTPPTLFIDTSAANIRGFGFFPIHKYELLKRFLLDNYQLETVVDGLIIYRLKEK